jgi:hypothetical protein
MPTTLSTTNSRFWHHTIARFIEMALASLVLLSIGFHQMSYSSPLQPTMFSTPYIQPTQGRISHLSQGDDLQSAIDSAALGDVIILKAGATWTGAFSLPNKTGTGWIYIISSDMSFLPEGKRVLPSDAVHMPKIIGLATKPITIQSAAAAHHFRFAGIDIEHPGAAAYSYVRLFQGGNMATSEAGVPSFIWFDRCLFHCASNTNQCEYGAIPDGRYMAIFDSYFDNFKTTTDDGGYCIKLVNGPGPIRIFNNYMEASGSCFFTGGDVVSLPGGIPSDIEFRGNYVTKRDGWGGTWRMKNLLEFKSCRRVLVEGNVFYHQYYDSTGGQYSSALVITPRYPITNPANPGASTIYAIEDITIRKNIIRDAGEGVRLYAGDISCTRPLSRVLIENCIFDEINGTNLSPWSTNSRLFHLVALGNGPISNDLIVRHCLFLFHNGKGYNSYFFEASVLGAISQNMVVENNIIDRRSVYGVMGNATTEGISSITAWNSNSTWKNNVIIGNPSTSLYPTKSPWNFGIATTIDAVGFTDAGAHNYLLTAKSAFKSWGSDGTDPGPDINALIEATHFTIAGDIGLDPPVNLHVIP